MMRRSVDLPQPEGPRIATNSPGSDVQIDAIERIDWPGKDPLDPAQIDRDA